MDLKDRYKERIHNKKTDGKNSTEGNKGVFAQFFNQKKTSDGTAPGESDTKKRAMENSPKSHGKADQTDREVKGNGASKKRPRDEAKEEYPDSDREKMVPSDESVRSDDFSHKKKKKKKKHSHIDHQDASPARGSHDVSAAREAHMKDDSQSCNKAQNHHKHQATTHKTGENYSKGNKAEIPNRNMSQNSFQEKAKTPKLSHERQDRGTSKADGTPKNHSEGSASNEKPPADAAAAEANSKGIYPFEVDAADHAETPVEAYRDIAPVLAKLAGMFSFLCQCIRLSRLEPRQTLSPCGEGPCSISNICVDACIDVCRVH
jgi:hypothetical protein